MAYLKSLKKQTNRLSYQPIPLYLDKQHYCKHATKPYLKLDLNNLFIKHPHDTFLIQVKNSDLIAWGIDLGDLLIAERTQEFLKNDLLIVKKYNEYKLYQYFTEIKNKEGETEKILFALDANESSLRIKCWDEIIIEGIVTNVIHQVRKMQPIARHCHTKQ